MQIELFRLKTDSFFTNTLLQIGDNKVVVSNFDITQSNKRLFGKNDYEYYMTIDKEHIFDSLDIEKDKDLIEYFNKFSKDMNLFKSIREDLIQRKITYQFSTW